MSLEPIVLEVSSFYTRAFGGVFLLRDFIKDIMIFEDEEAYKKAISDTDYDVILFHKDHKELVDTLVHHLILEPNFKKVIKTARYDRIKKHLFAGYLESPAHSYKEILDNHFLFKKYLNAFDIKVQKEITGVELYHQKKIVNKTLKIADFVSLDLIKTLHQPHSSLEEEHKELIWKLLTKIAPKDPLHLYWYDKNHFYKAYADWESSYQDWVIELILENNEKHEV